jgi:cyanocobalamin reductase (cyanide-eliminating) / alkylcobalamin dealkylase
MADGDRPTWKELSERSAQNLARHGLDLVQPFCAAWHNGASFDPDQRLFDFERGRALGLVVGNTKELWPRFRQALAADETLAAAPDPLDAYVEASVRAALAFLEPRVWLRFAHERVPSALPIQKIARSAGLAWLSPSHLSLHPRHGPWIALRAVAIVDVEGPPGERPAASDPCTPCPKPCLPALEHALRTTATLASASVEDNWLAWLAVRDACPEGKSSRYGDEQLRYHYTKARRLLESEP